MKYIGSLHNHTDMSNLRLRDSINTIPSLIDTAISLGHKCVAITEHESVSSALKAEKYYDKIKENNPDFKLIRGNEIYLVDDMEDEKFAELIKGYPHFILLAKDEIGHRQIREISSRAWLGSYNSRGMLRVPTRARDLKEVIEQDRGHVIGMTACLGGTLPQIILKGEEFGVAREEYMSTARSWIESKKEVFGEGNFYLELQPADYIEQHFVNKTIVELAHATNTPYVITNDAHYPLAKDRNVHKAFLNAENGEREVDAFYAYTYLMSDEEVRELLKNDLTVDELETAFTNIQKIADSCENYSLVKPLKIPQLQWKTANAIDENLKQKFIAQAPMLDTFLKSEESDKLLAELIMERLASDIQLQDARTLNEVNECLKSTWDSSEINNVRWSKYFLNLQGIVDGCWEAGSLVGAGRGSGIGFVLLYLLGITQINPLREESQTKRWRFLNPERVTVLDVDLDIEGQKRTAVMHHFRELYGEDRVANVLTLRTEKSKSALLTAARGLGMDVDEAQYYASLIEAERGILRTLHESYYGDKDKGIRPNRVFVSEMNKNPELWEVAKGIEGLISGMGIHAGGVVFVDEPFTTNAALMRTKNGEIITAFELHDAEELSLIKYDVLSIEALDKIHNCITLLCDYGYAEPKETLRETYESIVGVYNLERTNPKMWEMIWNHEVNALFQMEKQSGQQGIALIKPKSVDELATLNSAIRLMAQERGAERPLEKWARFRQNINGWIDEMRYAGLTESEINFFKNSPCFVDGMCFTQEDMMELLMAPELGGNSLGFADKARKVVAKKKMEEIDSLHAEYIENGLRAGVRKELLVYAWRAGVVPQLGYSFNKSHTLAYSIIGLQEMNLAFRFPVILWNTACLIADSGMSADSSDYLNDEDMKASVDYGKIATAIGKFMHSGIHIQPPHINKSGYTFSPDIESNSILYGMSGMNKIGLSVVKDIISNRPYKSLDDFCNKVKINKTQTFNLIKSGAFDELEGIERYKIAEKFAFQVSDTKTKLNMQNARKLSEKGLLNNFPFECAVIDFNTYLSKKQFKCKEYEGYYLDSDAYGFWERNFSLDELTPNTSAPSGFALKKATWKKNKDRALAPIKKYIQDHQEELLIQFNEEEIQKIVEKYCEGSYSKWEMDSISCYIHEHELAHVNLDRNEFVDFFDLSEEPDVEYTFTPKNSQREIPIYRIHRICGTVLDRDKAKKLVTLLTPTGVVTVQIYGDAFTHYDRQLSEVGADGKKHVIEKSMFSRGTKIVATGIRRGDNFLCKKYKKTPFHLIEEIVNVSEKGVVTTRARELDTENS